MFIETRLSNSSTPAECYVYRKPDCQTLALQRSAMCHKSRTAPTERDMCKIAAINILLIRSKEYCSCISVQLL